MENWNDTFVLEDKFLQDLKGVPLFSKCYKVVSERPNKKMETAHLRFIREYSSDLEKFLDKPVCNKIMLCVEELLTNMEYHGHNYNPEKSTVIYTSIFNNGVLVSLQGEGPGYDVKNVRQNFKNPDGSTYMGTRGRGHSIVKFLSDRAFSEDFGRQWYLLFNKKTA